MTVVQADNPGYLSRKTGVLIFLAFAGAYFCSALLRAITATLAPVLTQEFSLQARDLGLLAGGYFLGFAATQLPMGTWLDRHGPKHVVLWFMSLAVVGCVAFSFANSFVWLLVSRVIIGMGVSACLMAPLTGYRRWYTPATILRANSLMLMTAALGMLSSTLPVQWLMPHFGWRPAFWGLAVMALLSMAAIAWLVPAWRDGAPTLRTDVSSLPPGGAELARGGPSLRSSAPTLRADVSSLPPGGAELARGGPSPRSSSPTLRTDVSSLPPEGAELARGGPSLGSAASSPSASGEPASSGSYAEVWRNPYFRRMSPMAFFNAAGLIAVQTLWAGPWMVRVAGYTPLESATGLFYINAIMLVTYLSWGLVNPWLMRHGWHATRLVAWGVPVSLVVLAANIAAGPAAGWPAWALFCVSCTFMSLAQPAVGMAFPAALAGRAMSAYNLVIFIGVFIVQWGIGLLIDAFQAMGWSDVASFQAAMAVFLCCCIASYAYFLSVSADNSQQ